MSEILFVGSPSKVRALAALDRAAVGEHARVPSAVLGRDADRLAGRDAGLHVQLELAVQHEAREAVGAGDERHAGGVQSAEEFHHPLPGGAVGLELAAADVGRVVAPGALGGEGHVVGDRGERGVHVAGLLVPGALERRHGGVDDGLALGEQRDEVLDRLGVQVEVLRALADQVEAHDRARVGVRVGDEVQHELVDVLQLVVALARDALGARERGDVPADTQPARMRVGRDRPGPLRLDRVVELDLPVSALGVPVDGVLGLRDARDHEAAARGEGALALDVAGRLDVRTDRAARRDIGAEPREIVVVVAHVARAGDAARDLQRRVPGVLVRVHVEKAGKQRASGAFDDRRGILGRRSGGVNGCDPPLVHVDVGRLTERLRLRIEHAHVLDQDRLCQLLDVLLREVLEVLRLRLLLQALELGGRALVARDDHVAAADVDAREERLAARALEPDVVGLEPRAQDCVERDLALQPRRPDARAGELLASKLAAWQRGQPPAGVLRRAHDDCVRFGAAVRRQIDRGAGQLLTAAFRG